MSRLLPILLLTGFAIYCIWTDAQSVEPLSSLDWAIDIVIVGLALWSWISFAREKREIDD